MGRGMHSRLERLRAHTNGYTVTPRQYALVAYAALGALTLIVLSGAAVRALQGLPRGLLARSGSLSPWIPRTHR